MSDKAVIEPTYRINYLGGGSATLVPIRVVDCGGNDHPVTLTEDVARDLLTALRDLFAADRSER